MGKSRLEAFSDGVIAILITIMVLELKVPHEPTITALLQRAPTFLSYLLSFVYIGIYWGNHHHLIHTVKRVTPGVIWANLTLMFFLSLVPFATDWLGETHAAPLPTATYAVLMIITGVSFTILQRVIARQQTEVAGQQAHETARKKGMISVVAYASAAVLAFFWTPGSLALFVAVSLMWLVPDRRFEHVHGV